MKTIKTVIYLTLISTQCGYCVDDLYESGIGINKASINVNANGLGWAGGRFTVVNQSAKSVNTVLVTFKISDTAGEVLQFSQLIDGFLTKSPISAGEAVDYETGTTGSFQFRLAGVAASIDYIEFADGTRAGKQSALLFAKLAKERAEAVVYAQSIAARMDQGASGEEIMASLSSSQGDGPGTRTAKSILRNAAQAKGISALSQEAHRLAAIKVSSQ